jgi:uncharacterized membrane protein
MSKMFLFLAVLLIFTGALLMAVPRESAMVPANVPSASRAPGVPVAAQRGAVTFLSQARDVAEQVNAPLSILFGLVSLFYSRRTFLAQANRR